MLFSFLTSVEDDAFYPTLHSISAEFESIDNPYWKRDVAGYMDIGYVELTGTVRNLCDLTHQFAVDIHQVPPPKKKKKKGGKNKMFP